MFRNQFYIVGKDNKLENKYGFECEAFGNYEIFHCPELPFYQLKGPNFRIGVLGVLINPMHAMDQPLDILRKVVTTMVDFEQVLWFSGRFSGRYILLFEKDGQVDIIPDAIALRSVFYFQGDEGMMIASNPKLIYEFLGLEVQFSPKVKRYLESKEGLRDEFEHFGQRWFDQRIFVLLPNHSLHVNTFVQSRTPLFQKNFHHREERIIYASRLLRGTVASLVNRHNLWMPITAGYDSRLLLSFVRKYTDRIQFYMFMHSYWQSDAVIAKRISDRFGLCVNRILLKGSISTGFKKRLGAERVIYRSLPKMKNIEWHYVNSKGNRLLNLNGNGGEIVRGYIKGYVKSKHTFEDFWQIIRKPVIFKDEIKEWYQGALSYSEEYKISIADLFFWENDSSRWGGWYPNEQDIAIEEVSPFNNKEFIVTCLPMQGNDLFIELMERNWPELLVFPFNPLSIQDKLKKQAKNFIKLSNAYLKKQVYNGNK